MSLLLYCVAPEAVGETGARGVGGSAVGSEVRDGLRYFLSEANEGSTDLAVAAREVLGVIQDVFSRGPVLPFRYPTILKDELELNKLAAERGTAFAQFLAWVGQRVQMDVRIMREETKGPSAAAAKSGPPALGMTDTSGRVTGETPVLQNAGGETPVLRKAGTDYLAAKAARSAGLREAARTCREQAGGSEWRVEERGGGVLCHALIDRHEVISFQERMRRTVLPGGVKAVVSGPWPPAGFWEDTSH